MSSLESTVYPPPLPQEPIEDLGARPYVMRLAKVIVSQDTRDALTDYLIEHRHRAPIPRGSGRARPEYHLIGELIGRGLNSGNLDSELRKRNQTLTDVRTLLRRVLEIDTAPRPCPRNVAEAWWAQREEERISAAVEEIRRGVSEALALSEAPTSPHKSSRPF